MARLHTRPDGSVAREAPPDPALGAPAERAAWLARHGGDGVERPLDHDLPAGVIRTAPSPGRSLRSLDLAPPEAAAVLVATLRILERLDADGADHGALCAEVIVVDDEVRPPTVTLRDPTADDDPGSGRDALAIATIVDELLTGWRTSSPVRQPDPAWLRLGDTDQPLPLRRARTLAERLAPDDRETRPTNPTDDRAPSGAPAWRGLLLAATTALVGFAALPLLDRAGPRPIDGPEIVVEGIRYRVGRTGDLAVSPRDCATPIIVVLRPSSGHIWWTELPTGGHDAPLVHAAAIVPGASGLEMVDCARVRATGVAGSVEVPLSS